MKPYGGLTPYPGSAFTRSKRISRRISGPGSSRWLLLGGLPLRVDPQNRRFGHARGLILPWNAPMAIALGSPDLLKR